MMGEAKTGADGEIVGGGNRMGPVSEDKKNEALEMVGETEAGADGEMVGGGNRMGPVSEDKKRFPVMLAVTILMLGVTIATLVLIAITFFQNQGDREALLERQPDTYVVAYGMDHSFSVDELTEEGAIRYTAVISGVQVPGGVLWVDPTVVPRLFFEWTYSADEMVYIVSVHNGGAGVGEKTKVDIDFAPSSINSVRIDNEERMKIISGGKPGGSTVSFEIGELLPGEDQYVEIAVTGKTVGSIDVWSEGEGTIENVSILEVSIEPDINFGG
jgi:hypothetical protein